MSRLASCVFVLVAGCTTGAAVKPVLPPIFDSAIVFGQRVGPVSLGMTEAQLVAAVGEPTSNVDYGGGRRGVVYAKLGLSAVLENGTVVRVSPSDGRYSTASGIRVLAPLPAGSTTGATAHDRSGVTSYCFDGAAALVVRSTQAAKTAPDCAVGAVCDIVVGGCVP